MGTKQKIDYDYNRSLQEEGLLAPKLVRGTTFADLYEVVSESTQQGGMGKAILCRSKLDKKYYVLKTFNQEQYKEQFRKEIEFALKLDKNPYIVYTQTAIQEKDKVYLVMELVGKQPNNFEDKWKTKTLKNIIQEIKIEEKYKYAIEFCRGMQYLNRIGMKSHRDIKPENIFITEDRHIKIADFGLVGIKNDGSGTEGYRSPEQARKEKTNIQSDIYSFGVVLYEMFNGGKNPYNKTKTSLKEEEFILKEYEKEHPSKNCRNIIQKCGEKEQKDRYKDFKEIEEEILKEAKNELGKEFEVEKLQTKKLVAGDYGGKGYGYYILKLYKTAIKYYDKVIELAPKAVDAYLSRGNGKYYLKQYDQAIKDYNKAIELNPKFFEAYHNLGLSKQELKQYDKALEDFNKTIELAPKYVNAYNNRGNVKRKLHQYEEAIKDYNKAIELNPKFVLAYYNRGLINIDLHQYEEAIKDYNKAIELDFKCVLAYNNRGNVKRKLHQYEEAIKDYNKVIELEPKKTNAYNQICYCYLYINKIDMAIESIKKALTLEPKNANLIDTLGDVYKYNKEYDKAIEEYKKAISMNKQQISSYNNLIEVYKILGKEKELKNNKR